LKNKLLIILDIIIAVLGMLMIVIFTSEWMDIDFAFDTIGSFGNLDGNGFFVLIVVGVAMIFYSFWDYFIFRRKR